MPFAVSWHNLVITSQNLLNQSMSPIWNWIWSLFNIIIDFWPVIFSVFGIIFVLYLIYRLVSIDRLNKLVARRNRNIDILKFNKNSIKWIKTVNPYTWKKEIIAIDPRSPDWRRLLPTPFK